MNLEKTRYSQFSLCREMLETADIIRQMSGNSFVLASDSMEAKNNIFITGEGSSRIVPAKNMIYKNMLIGSPIRFQQKGLRKLWNMILMIL